MSQPSARQNQASWQDNGSNIPLSLTTAWLKMANINGFQRVRRINILGAYKSPHTLTVQVAYDFNPAVVQTDVITVTNNVPYEYLINLKRQKCTALQITISDSNSTGEGLSLTGITLEVGVKKGLNKLPPTQTYG